MNQYIKLKIQNGFSIVAVILVIVAVIVAIGVWGLSGSHNNSGKNAAVFAATIINQGFLYKTQLEKYRIKSEKGALIDGNIALSPNITSEFNLFNPVDGMEPLKPPMGALEPNPVFPLGIWAINASGFSTNENNTSLYYHTAFLVAGLIKSVCENINFNLHGNINIPVFANTYANVLPDINTTNYRSIMPLYLHNILAVKGWKNGCLLHKQNSNIKEYFYFQTIQ